MAKKEAEQVNQMDEEYGISGIDEKERMKGNGWLGTDEEQKMKRNE